MQPTLDWRKRFYPLLASRVTSRLLAPILPFLDRLVFRLSRGQQTLVSMLAGLPSIILTTTGAKSGQPRQTPLLGIPQGKSFIIIGSNFGGKHHPAWVYNLRAHAEVKVSLNGFTGEYIAREVFGEEREQCWNEAVKSYPGYHRYKQRAGREIGVFLLEPKQP